MIVLRSTPEPEPPAPLSSSLTVYVTADEKARIKQDSATAGLSMSAWARSKLTA